MEEKAIPRSGEMQTQDKEGAAEKSLHDVFHVVSMGQGLLSFLYLVIFLVNFLMNSENLAPFYGASSLYWAASAVREEVLFRLNREKKQRVYGVLFLLFALSFLFLFIKKIR